MWALAFLVLLLLTFWLCFKKDRALPPGPFCWPLVGCIFSLKQPLHLHFQQLGKTFGPILYLRIGFVPFVVVNSPEGAKEVLKTRDLEFADRPKSEFFRCFSLGYNDMSCSDYGDLWRKLRRTTSLHLFSTAKLKETAVLRELEIRNTIKSIRGMSGPIDLKAAIADYTCNSLCLILFGKKIKPVMQVLELVNELSEEALLVNLGELFPLLDCLDLHGVQRKTKATINNLSAILRGMIEQHESENCKQKEGFLGTLTDLKAEGILSENNVVALLIDMVAGGIDTSRAVLEWTMAELLNNPSVIDIAQEELDRVVGSARPVQESDLVNLHYLQAIFKESLRLHPVAPLGVHHYNVKQSTVAGYKVPAKCKVLVNLWAVARDPAYWNEPNDFKPERFLGSNIGVSGHHFELLPFSAGRRMCPGQPLIMRSGPLALATLLHAFDWKLPSGGFPPSLKGHTGTVGSKMTSELVAVPHYRLREAAY